MSTPSIGQSVVYVTPDQHDDDAVGVVVDVLSETEVHLDVTFADGSKARVNFCQRGTKTGRWHPLGEE